MKIKKGDKVKVALGKDRGRTGVVKVVLAKERKAIIEGINLVKKHVKPDKKRPGGIIEIERPILLNKLGVICPSCNKRVRVGYQLDKSGKKYRICRKCQSLLN